MTQVQAWWFPDADTYIVDALRRGALAAPEAKWLAQLDHLDTALGFVTNFDCAIDGGAHVGTWAQVLGTRFRRVLACEPSPDTFACLDRNLAGTTVERCPVALGACAGVGSMTWTDAQRDRGNTGARFLQAGGEIPVVAIDDWALPSLGFLKLDVEGSEVAALQGARATLARCRPIVLVEHKFLWTRHFGLPKGAVAGLLTALEYSQLASVGCDQIWGPR